MVQRTGHPIKLGENTAAKNVIIGYKDTYTDNYVWPSQTQWMRSYITAANGLEWNGVTKYRTTLQDWEKNVLAEAGYKTESEGGTYTEDDLQKIAHLGTRMFVLANNDSRSESKITITDMKGGKWWTICVPFNMTKKQVEATFGKGTNVCLFNQVKRTISPTSNTIHLKFQVDVCQFHKCEATDKGADGKWNYANITAQNAPTDDDVVIFAHESYMIHPTKTDDDPITLDLSEYEIQTGSPQPTLINSEEIEITEDAEEGPEYRFVGNYIGTSNYTSNSADDTEVMYVPAYSYVYATNGETDANNDKIYKFWFVTDNKLVWKANKSVVQTTDRSMGLQDFESFFKGNATSAKQVSYFGNEEGKETTSIDEKFVIIAGENADAPIYSIDGLLVSKDGDKTGLAKGLYIQNGKKFAVK